MKTNNSKGARKMNASKSILDCPALHFNWGFHDARSEAARGKSRDVSSHFDRAYADGYTTGLRADGQPIPADSPAFVGWE